MHEHFSFHFPQVELQYFGRDESPSSATGSFKQYQQEQKELVEGAFGPNIG
jgi:2-oxoglutarate dehydrogenase complex dehydrogenase (E1) component-like enzyme